MRLLFLFLMCMERMVGLTYLPSLIHHDLKGILIGWFISHAEAPSNSVRQHRCRLLCYTRLCLNISAELAKARMVGIGFYPSKTHQLIVGQFEILSTDTEGSKGVLTLISSLTSSLPRDIGGRTTAAGLSLKQDAISERDRNLKHLAPVIARHVGMGDPRLSENDFAACAESVNYFWLVKSLGSILTYSSWLYILQPAHSGQTGARLGPGS